MSGTTGTRPERLAVSNKRARQNALYAELLPLVPAPSRSAPGLIDLLLHRLSALGLSRSVQYDQIQVQYDTLTQSLWPSSPQEMEMLWRRGFFGKGILSRSEPAWKKRVENKLTLQSDAAASKQTAEEVTAQRRKERIVYKHQKRAERDAEKLAAATQAASQGKILVDQDVLLNTRDAPAAVPSPSIAPSELRGDLEPIPDWHLTAESTQLQPEEAFFLLFALGVVSIRTSSPAQPRGPEMSILQAWRTFLLSAAPIRQPASLTTNDPRLARWDSPFLISYVSYHHYRSLGWVPRSGIKFCVDWVLYGPGGPVGSHAEFAVVVLPSYADPKDAQSNPFRTSSNEWLVAEGDSRKNWRWFQTISRICSGVKKTLVLCYVHVPPLSTLPSPDWIAQNPAQALQCFSVREVTVRRWVAGRMRD